MEGVVVNDSQRRRMNGKRWRFGRGQTFNEEGDEIDAAQSAGLGALYLRGQRWATMIEQERAARRSGEHKLRDYR
jgi:hypothetical protein